MKTADKKLLQTEIKNFRRRLQARNESSQTLLRVKDWQRPNDTYLFQNALAGNPHLYTPMTDYRRTDDPLQAKGDKTVSENTLATDSLTQEEGDSLD